MCNWTVVNYNSFIYYRIITWPAWFTANCDLLIGTQIPRPIDKCDLLVVLNILAIVFGRRTIDEKFRDLIAPRKSFCASVPRVKVVFDISMVLCGTLMICRVWHVIFIGLHLISNVLSSHQLFFLLSKYFHSLFVTRSYDISFILRSANSIWSNVKIYRILLIKLVILVKWKKNFPYFSVTWFTKLWLQFRNNVTLSNKWYKLYVTLSFAG